MFGPNSLGKIEWVGYSDTNSMVITAEYLKYKNLGGASIWSIENDDFNGQYCNQGIYPLLNALNKELVPSKEIKLSTQVPPLTSSTTTITTTISRQRITSSKRTEKYKKKNLTKCSQNFFM